MIRSNDLEYLIKMYKQRDEDWHRLYYEKLAHIQLSEEDYLEFCTQTGETPA